MHAKAIAVVAATIGAFATPAAADPPGEAWHSWTDRGKGEIALTLADPGALYADSEFHVYGTSYFGYRVLRFTGRSLDSPGTRQDDAMPQLPAWVDPAQPYIWAPAVAQIGNGYVLYFAASSSDPAQNGSKCIGAATAASPDGPFVPQTAPLHCTPTWWSIDPYVVEDGDTHYLLWRQDDPQHPTGRVVGRQLADDGLSLTGPAEQTLLVGESAWEDGWPDSPDNSLSLGIGPVENPAMARHPKTGEWLLTWAANRWETENYATGLAICQGPLGPCERVSRDTPWVRASSDPSVTTTANFAGFGGVSFADGPDGELYAVAHGYRQPRQEGEERIGWAYRVVHDPASPSRYRLTEF